MPDAQAKCKHCGVPVQWVRFPGGWQWCHAGPNGEMMGAQCEGGRTKAEIY